MTLPVIKHYYDEMENIVRYAETRNETAVRRAFHSLLNEYAKSKGLLVIEEERISGKKIRPDGTLKDSFSLSIGYWESKDEEDDLEKEIRSKFNKGYPKSNILFEDSKTAILYQNEQLVLKIDMTDPDKLDSIVKTFINYETEDVRKFRDAIDHFKEDIPRVTDTLRKLIADQEKINSSFIKARNVLLEILKNSINEDVNTEDINEMLIQHILTADIFNTVFNSSYYHRENNIARELEKVLDTFFSRAVRESTLEKIHKDYLNPIQRTAYSISDHHEKQKFLKVFYENFYKSYNPKAADKLGVVYTPNEIVRFMIEGTDHLLYEYFNKYIHDEGVDILDPATGTGTFICDLIDYIKKDKLEYKYKNEIHANELAILPYYIANLNIEFTYSQKMGGYVEFENLCLVDTLDNSGWFSRKGEQNLFVMSAENAERIKRQNKKRISVVIGNPPYNAKQLNYNFENSNRAYREIDEKIKRTYIKEGTAKNKNVVYDMYTRFYRWAMDRVDENGIISFITNNSFIDGRAFDGFRKCIQNEFNFAYIIDLGGNIRELSGRDGIFLNERHTIFGSSAAVGIAICFLIKIRGNKNKCRINYIHPCDIRATREEKLMFLSSHRFHNIPFKNINPDKNNNWINQTNNDFHKLIPLMDRDVKSGHEKNRSIFKNFSRGIASQRDEWVYDFNKENLEFKMKYFVKIYQESLKNPNTGDKFKIKWDRELDKYLERRVSKKYNKDSIVKSLYRPYVIQFFYFDKHFNGMTYQWPQIYNEKNKYIAYLALGNNKPFHCISSDKIIDLHLTGDSQCLPLYSFDAEGNRQDNITDWALEKFQEHYKKKNIKKEDIFHYVYAVLHNPAYRKKYEIDLKKEFPRIPFYEHFSKWRDFGMKLMEIHIEYETAKPYKLTVQNSKGKDAVPEPKAKLKADRENGIIVLDENTSLSGIPKEAWEYKLGNRSALEWVLDQYKEKKPKDSTIAEKFNTYKFADYKEQVIELLKKVCTVSIETVRIVKEMGLEKG